MLNVLTGNLDREGGAMFTLAAAGQRNSTRRARQGPRRAPRPLAQPRARPADEAFGELPVACLAEEIDTPGEGQVRALITVAGNPVVSTPNSGRLERAVEALDFMLLVDIYVNETTRHADVILPAPGPLEKSHYDLALYQLAVRNVANYSPPCSSTRTARDEWEVLLRLAGVVSGQGPDADVEALDELVIAHADRPRAGRPALARGGRDPGRAAGGGSSRRRGPERVLDFCCAWARRRRLRRRPDGLTLDVLERSPHGVDLGPHRPRLPEVLRTATGKIELAPEPIVADLAAAARRAGASAATAAWC